VSRREIRRETFVPLDPAAAIACLRRVAGGRTFAVRPVCRLPALQAEIALLRDVVVRLEMPAGEEWCSVRCQPDDGGPFPCFTGTLRVVGSQDGTRLRLDGGYEDVTAERADPVDGGLGFRLVQATTSAVLDAVVRSLRSGEGLHRPFPGRG
jgi:hypothetical protein